MNLDETKLDGDYEPDPLLREGQLFGAYRIIRQLGRGGMGEVYEAEHLELKARFALKLIRPELTASAERIRQFREEARTMCRLKHPNVLPVDDFGETAGLFWLRMPLVSGGSLDELLKNRGGRLPPDEVSRILDQLLAGLAHVHASGVCHRDLKPGNLMLGDEGEIRITDFGIASAGSEACREDEDDDPDRTRLETTTVDSGAQGSFSYMSPEQKKGEAGDPRSDLYAVGVIAYELLTGGNTLGQQRPSELVKGLDPAWDVFVGRATRLDPEQRFRDAVLMRQAIPGQGQATGAKSPRAASTGSRSHKSWLLAGGAGLATLLVLAAIFFTLDNPEGNTDTASSRPDGGGSGEPSREAPVDKAPEPSPPEFGETFGIEDLGLRMLWLEGGRFQMGSEMGEEDEMPVHRQKVSSFWLGETEVTRGQWAALMGGTMPDRVEGNLPVIDLSLDEARRFVQLLNAREEDAGRLPEGYVYALPSEPEWEYACRAGSSGPYAGDLDDMAWFKQKGVNGPQAVANLEPNSWGLYDMHGNVWEWTTTPYAPYPDKRARDDFGNVLRGGGWFSEASACRSAERGFQIPGVVDLRPGLRIALKQSE